MNKKLVIFDLDGTLLNTIDDLAVSANYALRQHGYPEHELPAYRYFVGNGITKLIERALPEAERCEPAILQLRICRLLSATQDRPDPPLSGYPGIIVTLIGQRYTACCCFQ